MKRIALASLNATETITIGAGGTDAIDAGASKLWHIVQPLAEMAVHTAKTNSTAAAAQPTPTVVLVAGQWRRCK